MWGLLKLVGLAGGGSVSLPMILGGAFALIASLAGLTAWGMHAWENHKTALRNEGSMQCINTVRDEEVRQLKSENQRLAKSMADEQERASRLENANKAIRAESAKSHQEIAELMSAHQQKSGGACKVPDAVIDAINRPLKK